MEGWEGGRKKGETAGRTVGACPCVQRAQSQVPLSQKATAPSLPRAPSALTARPPPCLRHTASP